MRRNVSLSILATVPMQRAVTSLGGTPPCGGAPDRAEGMIRDLDTSQIHRNWPAMIGLSSHAATKLDRQP